MPRESKPLWHKGNGCWYARVGEPDGKGRARPVYFNKPLEDGTKPPAGERDERGAWAYFNALRERREARYVDTADPTVAGMAELYLAWCEGRVADKTMSRGHLLTLQTRLGKFAVFDPGGGPCGGRKARSVGVEHLEAWVKFLKTVHRPHYVKNCVRGVQGLFGWAARDVPGREPRRLIARNPLDGFRAPGAGRMPERFAERSEAAAFLRFFREFAGGRASDPHRSMRRRFDRRTLLLERVLIRTGCRPGEACGMRWDQIKWEGGVSSAGHRFAKVFLEEHKTAEKTGKVRVVYLTPTLTRALRRLNADPDRHPVFVFTHMRGLRGKAGAGTPDRWGDPWDSIALAAKVRRVRGLAVKAGVDLKEEGPNRLVNYRWRHTAISSLLMMGVDTATVAELTGTSPEMIRMHYGHLLDSHLALAAEKLTVGRKPKR